MSSPESRCWNCAAGLAMQARNSRRDGDGSIRSPEALMDPLGPANTIEGDFLHIPQLKGIITDTHFKERERLGRLFARPRRRSVAILLLPHRHLGRAGGGQ